MGLKLTYTQALLIKEALTDAVLFNQQEAEHYENVDARIAEEHESKAEAFRELLKELNL